MKKLLHFIKKNCFLFIFTVFIIFVALFSFNKLFISKQTYIFAKVKIGQGLWWATTAEPPLWLVNSLSKPYEDPEAKVLKINYYPVPISGINSQLLSQDNDQYNTYLTLKLKVTTSKNGSSYYFNRSMVAIGSPIDLDISNVQVSGTVVSFSKQPIKDEYIEKYIYITKENPFAWEYEAIKIDDYYFDGENKVFEVVGKEIVDNGNALTVKAKMRLKKVDNLLIFGEDRTITVGKNISIFTNNFNFSNYTISRID
ncbi:MAG: hypothetical protein WC741_02690 [Patescibacteria group bacterium]|jgi:hypothetical protein